ATVLGAGTWGRPLKICAECGQSPPLRRSTCRGATMHSHSTAPWTHGHAFLGVRHDEHERRTWGVVALTAAMMLVEIVGGGLFGSIALVADGWHMATHVIALAIAGFAYLFARR